MSDPEVHIAAWEKAGLIDADLAARLRQTVGAAPDTAPSAGPEAPPAPSDGPRPGPTSAGSFFGPSVTIGEMFAYLGVAFLLGAWIAFLGRVAGTTDRDAIMTAGTGVAGLAMFGLGVFLGAADPRRRRGAGIAFLTTTVLAAGAAAFALQLDVFRNSLTGSAPAIFIATVALIVAAVLRGLLASVSTQLGFVAALTGLAGAVLSWLLEPNPPLTGGGLATNDFPIAEPIGPLLVSGGWWLLVALGLGVLALREERYSTPDGEALRRAAITRFWAGTVAVVGLTSALTASGSLGGDRYGRLLEPLVADLAILALGAILVERAFRRGSHAFILPAAIALIVALTDFNFSYLSQSTDVGLLIEGAILLGVGFAGDRVRRRLDRPGGGPPGPLTGDGQAEDTAREPAVLSP